MSDQSGEQSLALLDLYRSGLARQRVGWGPDGIGKLAKACGSTAAEVQEWIAPDGPWPMPGQALALVRALRLAAVDTPVLNGAVK